MSEADSCILGQAWMKKNGFVSQGFDDGLRYLFTNNRYEKAIQNGFDSDGETEEWSLLADLWIAEIRDRRKASREKVSV